MHAQRWVAAGIGASAILAVGAARADCLNLPLALTRPIVERFIFNPQTLLRDAPRAGDPLTQTTGVLAIASRATPLQIMRVSKAASVEQRAAIAAGLAIAALRCKAREPQVTLTLERLLRDSDDRVMQRAFAERLRNDGLRGDEKQAQARAQLYRDQLARAMRPDPQRRSFDVTGPGATGPVPDIAAIGAVPRVSSIPSMR